MKLRVAESGDADAVLAVWAAARGAGISDRREDLERLLERSPDGLLVAEDAGRIVGAVIAVWDGWRGTIARLPSCPPTAAAAAGARGYVTDPRIARFWRDL